MTSLSVEEAAEAYRLTELEVCPTPPNLAAAILAGGCDAAITEGGSPATTVLEPSAGDGAFVAAACARWPRSRFIAVEPRSECAERLAAAGAELVLTKRLEDVDPAVMRSADLVVGNPPYSLAEAHVRLLLAAMRPGAHLVFLLRLSFFGSQERVDLWREHRPNVGRVLVPRPDFKLNKHGRRGTDSAEYVVLTWRRGYHQAATLLGDPLIWRPPARAVVPFAERRPRRPRGRRVQNGAAPPPAPVQPPATSAGVIDLTGE